MMMFGEMDHTQLMCVVLFVCLSVCIVDEETSADLAVHDAAAIVLRVLVDSGRESPLRPHLVGCLAQLCRHRTYCLPVY